MLNISQKRVWWDKINYFLAFIEPIIDMLSLTDIYAIVLSMIYDM